MIESFSVSCENIYVTTVKMNKWKGKLKEKTPINDEIKIMRVLINHDDEGIEVRVINIQAGVKSKIKNISKKWIYVSIFLEFQCNDFIISFNETFSF